MQGSSVTWTLSPLLRMSFRTNTSGSTPPFATGCKSTPITYNNKGRKEYLVGAGCFCCSDKDGIYLTFTLGCRLRSSRMKTCATYPELPVTSTRFISSACCTSAPLSLLLCFSCLDVMGSKKNQEFENAESERSAVCLPDPSSQSGFVNLVNQGTRDTYLTSIIGGLVFQPPSENSLRKLNFFFACC